MIMVVAATIDPLCHPAEEDLAMAALGGGATRRGLAARCAGRLLLSIGAFMPLPLAAMPNFPRAGSAARAAWSPGSRSAQPRSARGDLGVAQLAALTVVGMLVLLVPTMVWVQLRLPGLLRLVEFVCLLPLTIPAIVLVVGSPGLPRVSYLLGDPRTPDLRLRGLVLPFAYRSLATGLAAIDLVTLPRPAAVSAARGSA
jgi:putative spermidine/putrescine transport system permease protein